MTQENGLLLCWSCGSSAVEPDEGHTRCSNEHCYWCIDWIPVEEWNTRTPVIPAAEIDDALEALEDLDIMNLPIHDLTRISIIRSVLNKMRGV